MIRYSVQLTPFLGSPRRSHFSVCNSYSRRTCPWRHFNTSCDCRTLCTRCCLSSSQEVFCTGILLCSAPETSNEGAAVRHFRFSAMSILTWMSSHDPEAEDAVVMKAPSKAHEAKYNKKWVVLLPILLNLTHPKEPSCDPCCHWPHSFTVFSPASNRWFVV